MRAINTIVIHCSASKYGSFEVFDSWHKERNFTKFQKDDEIDHYCGYHYVIMNAFPTSASTRTRYISSLTDGRVVMARPLSIQGCHVRGMNANTIGVCYVGFSPTPMQLQSLLYLCRALMLQFNVMLADVIGHNECYGRLDQDIKKTCPNFDMEAFRKILSGTIL